jgi:hypothetical protein
VGAPKPGGPPGVPGPRGVPGKGPPVPGKSPHGGSRGRVSRVAAFLQLCICRRPAAAAIRRGWRRPIAACGTRTRTAAAPRPSNSGGFREAPWRPTAGLPGGPSGPGANTLSPGVGGWSPPDESGGSDGGGSPQARGASGEFPGGVLARVQKPYPRGLGAGAPQSKAGWGWEPPNPGGLGVEGLQETFVFPTADDFSPGAGLAGRVWDQLRHTDTQPHSHTDTQTHRQTETQTHRHRHTHIHG